MLAMESDIKDTAAWRVMEQIIEHTYGGGSDMDSEAALSVCESFKKGGGKWKDLMDGDPEHLSRLESCIDKSLGSSKIARIALRVAFGNGPTS